jgi:hypothetical protein
MSEKRKDDKLAQLRRLAIPHEQIMMAIKITNLRLRGFGFAAFAILVPTGLSQLINRLSPPQRYSFVFWAVLAYGAISLLCSAVAVLMSVNDLVASIRLNAWLREARDEIEE